MLKSVAQDSQGRAVIIVGLAQADLDQLGDRTGGGVEIDLAELFADRLDQMPPDIPGRPLASARIVILVGRNEDEIKTKMGSA